MPYSPVIRIPDTFGRLACRYLAVAVEDPEGRVAGIAQQGEFYPCHQTAGCAAIAFNLVLKPVVICIGEYYVITVDVTNMTAGNYISQIITLGICNINQYRKVHKHSPNL